MEDLENDAGSGTRTSVRAPDRGQSRAERRAAIGRMVTLLGEALGTQIRRLAASTDPAPDGWWFTPDTRR